MFTGLVEVVGRIAAIEGSGPGRRLRIESALPTAALALGESVAVDGACLTVAAIGEGSFTADASHETIERTTLGEARPGRRVHLERALRLGDRLGGHLVTGHIDATGRLTDRRRVGDTWDLSFTAPEGLAPQIVEKGSIAVDGVSLTVNRCGPGRFSVTVVPFTAAETTLLERAVGGPVNLETDVIGKYVVHVLGRRGAVSRDDAALADVLRRGGFL